MTLAVAQRSLWFLLLLLLLFLPLGKNEGGEFQTGLQFGFQQCYPHEEFFLSARRPCHHPSQSVTAKRLQLPWWCALMESLFLLLLVKLLQL
ncbi:uncharacterized protein LOC108107236 [Drosophila eugracilis]|uniref:uncharacterized protein LOC108107236 n=1 Tax=Drosophila eugracilis TaxID=29029 RepID=UPI0007E65CF8|nr:uncharacterized protein LOC108107236 [Drosophila eugracilis]